MSKTSDDVIVIGAGPGGAAAAYYCASAGLRVTILEKATLPREKVCGDGLTPRAVAELLRLGVDPAAEPGWRLNRGLRLNTGRHTWHLPWPEVEGMPSYGATRRRADLDHHLARRAVAAGAHLREGVKATGPLLSPDGGRVLGVRALGADREPLEFRSAVVVAADGVSSRFAVALGIPRREDRPLGTAYRAYYSAPLRGRDDWMENQLELWEGRPGRSELLPGYGWIFPVGDGVNIGLGSVSSSPARQARVEHNYRDLLRRYVATLPAEWQLEAAGPIRGAALPMGLGRTPLYARGTLLVGDAGGMVNPFNGEGIGYALLAGRLAAETIVEAHDAGSSPRLSEAELATYPRRIAAHLGGYFTLGRYFTRLIEHPQVMAFGTRYALPLPPVRRLLHQLLSDSYQTKGGDLTDRVITSLARLVPAA